MNSSQHNFTPLPDAFSRRIREQFPDSHPDFIAALDRPPLTSIRLNPHKWSRIQGSQDLPGDPVPWSINGRFLQERPSFTLDPLFHAGSYYVQEASSMFLEYVLSRLANPKQAESPAPAESPPGIILDACAAPGGKSTLLAAFFPESLVVANEVIRSRVSPLMENSIKWGTGNLVVTQNDPSHFSALPGFFDLILTDAPCSGEGLFRKDPSARLEWSADNATHCSLRQRSILTGLWPALKPGGYLIYTTCTFNPEENERNVAWLLGETGGECVRIDMPDDSSYHQNSIHEVADGSVTGYGFYPHRTPGEGFFLSVIRKNTNDHVPGGKTARSHSRRAAGRASHIQSPDPAAASNAGKWFNGSGFNWYQIRERLFRIKSSHLHTLEHLSGVLTIRYAGTEVGRVIRDEVLPAPAAALDIHLDSAVFPMIDCSLEDALGYLRRENLAVPPDAKQGWHLVRYQGLALGWTKNIGKRMNNYYPSGWRIRKAPQ